MKKSFDNEGWLVLTRAIGQGITIYDKETNEEILRITLNDVRYNYLAKLGFKGNQRYAILRDEVNPRIVKGY